MISRNNFVAKPAALAPFVSLDETVKPQAPAAAAHLLSPRHANIRPQIVPRPAPAPVPGDVASKSIPVAPEPPAVSAAPVDPNASARAASEEATSSQQRASLVQVYVASLARLIDRNKIYPRDAVDREEEGLVVMEVTLNGNGKVLGSVVKGSSRFASLDQAALATVQKIGTFPAPPPALGESVHLTVPLQFRIERRN